MTFILEGTHVCLEPLEFHHVDGLADAAAGDRSRYGWTGVPEGIEGAKTFISEALRLAESGSQIPFAVRFKDTGEVVGSTRYLNIERWGPSYGNETDDPDSVEIGHTWYAFHAQGTQVNPQAKLLLLTQAFEVWGCKRVQLKTDARNERSRSAILRVGAKFEGILRNYQPASGSEASPGEIRDTAMFSITDEEWPSVKQGLFDRLIP
ncbi:MAG: GNAT family N-acetyltransferase [Acidimicrobiales bacterium]